MIYFEIVGFLFLICLLLAVRVLHGCGPTKWVGISSGQTTSPALYGYYSGFG